MVAKVRKVSPAAGLIVTLAARIKRREEKLVNPVGAKKGKRDLNTLHADLHRVPVVKVGKVKAGVKSLPMKIIFT